MEPHRVKRRLAAILAADVVGYSRLMGADDEGTLARLRTLRRELIDPAIAAHHGRMVKTTGDGVLVEFASVVDAVRCAIMIQTAMAPRNREIDAHKRIEFRIGVNLGDVLVEDDDLFGDGVNVAARLESIAEPGGICLSEDAYRHARDKVDATFFDIGEQRLKNIVRSIRVYRIDIGDDRQRSQTRTSLPLPQKPSIAVLPFQNMSGDPEQEYFADGMVEEIITALSRIKWLFVIARNSSFTYKGQSVDVKHVGRELGVLYVLEGSVRKAGNRMRITGQLIDATNGAHLWADRFDGSLEDVFELQDNVALSVAGVIEPTLQAAEVRRSAQRPTADLTAYDLYLRARADAESWEKPRMLRALDLVRQALEHDPHFGAAMAVAVMCHAGLHVSGWSKDLPASRREALDHARKSLLVAGDDPYVLANAAHAIGEFGEDIAAALALIDRCLKLNPSFARGWLRSGWLRVWSGQPDLAITHFETFTRLSPRENRAGPLLGVGVCHFFKRELEEARTILLGSLQENRTWAPTHRFLASCCAHLGRLEEARDIIARLREITPIVIPNADHWRNAGDREFYLEGLRMAASH